MALGYDGKLYILAFDHRGSFQKKMFGIQGDPTPEETETIADAKRLYDRLREHAQDLGSADELEAIQDILHHGNGAQRQRVVYEANRDYAEVMREIVEATSPA